MQIKATMAFHLHIHYEGENRRRETMRFDEEGNWHPHVPRVELRNTADISGECMSVSQNVKHRLLIGYGNFTLRHVTERTENL